MPLPSFYSAGTATVAAGGVAVTGQNTAWLNSVQPGDLFGTHKGSGVRIASVNSNTSITLAYAWPAAAQAAAAYEIQITPDVSRMDKTTRDIMEMLQNGNLMALAGLVSAQDRLPYFDGAGTSALAIFTAFARQLLGATSAANAYSVLGEIPTNQLPQRLWTGALTITDWDTAIDAGFYNSASGSANGPNTAFLCGIVFTRGNTHAVQIVADFTNKWIFVRTRASGVFSTWRKLWTGYDVLQAVAITDGVPTGGLMDYGNNANGFYMRFANGLMICRSPTIALAPDLAAGSLFVSADTPWNMPGTFSTSDFSVVYSIGTGQRWTSARPTSATQAYIRQWSFATSATLIGGIAVAIGRWF